MVSMHSVLSLLLWDSLWVKWFLNVSGIRVFRQPVQHFIIIIIIGLCNPDKEQYLCRWEEGTRGTLNDRRWPPLCVNYCGLSVFDERFQRWSWPKMLHSQTGGYLLRVPRGRMRQVFSAPLITSSHINKQKINSRAEWKAEIADMIFMIASCYLEEKKWTPYYWLERLLSCPTSF